MNNENEHSIWPLSFLALTVYVPTLSDEHDLIISELIPLPLFSIWIPSAFSNSTPSLYHSTAGSGTPTASQ